MVLVVKAIQDPLSQKKHMMAGPRRHAINYISRQ